MKDEPKNAGIDRPRSIWGDNPRVRNIVLSIVAALLLARIVTTLWLVEDTWRPTARWFGLAVAPNPDKLQANAKLRGNVGQFFGDDVYPEAARDAGQQGSVRAKLRVAPSGRVDDCQIMKSSHYDSLDFRTCEIATDRVRFEPARDSQGVAIASSYNLAVRWVLPDE